MKCYGKVGAAMTLTATVVSGMDGMDFAICQRSAYSVSSVDSFPHIAE